MFLFVKHGLKVYHLVNHPIYRLDPVLSPHGHQPVVAAPVLNEEVHVSLGHLIRVDQQPGVTVAVVHHSLKVRDSELAVELSHAKSIPRQAHAQYRV